MKMDIEVIVLSATRFSMKDDDGKPFQGVSCVYLPEPTLAPKVNGENSLGLTAVKCSFDYDTFSRFQSVPGLYKFNCEFGVTGGLGGKPTLRPVGFDFLAPLVDLGGKNK